METGTARPANKIDICSVSSSKRENWASIWLACRRIVRTCAREGVDNIINGQKVLEKEATRYNYKQVHSTTSEVPYYRFKRLTGEGKSLFREFSLPAPYISTKDAFALRDNRTVNAYRKISFNKLTVNITGVLIRDSVGLRIISDLASGLAEIRFWYKDKLVGTQIVKNEDLNLANFLSILKLFQDKMFSIFMILNNRRGCI